MEIAGDVRVSLIEREMWGMCADTKLIHLALHWRVGQCLDIRRSTTLKFVFYSYLSAVAQIRSKHMKKQENRSQACFLRSNHSENMLFHRFLTLKNRIVLSIFIKRQLSFFPNTHTDQHQGFLML